METLCVSISKIFDGTESKDILDARLDAKNEGYEYFYFGGYVYFTEPSEVEENKHAIPLTNN